MQADLEKSQEELGSKEFNATAGGGAIEVIVSGDKKLKNIDGNTGKEIKEENNEMDAVMQTNKMMSWFVPIMSISIAFIAPLGLALYWLISNILMIAERLIIDKVVKS